MPPASSRSRARESRRISSRIFRPAERALVFATPGPVEFEGPRGDRAEPGVEDQSRPGSSPWTTACYRRTTSWRSPSTSMRTSTKLAAGHVPMLSRPNEVAAVIVDAANKAGR